MSLTLARLTVPGLLLALSLAGATRAEEVTLEHDGLTLNGNLTLAEGTTLADGVLLVTHGTLAHNAMEIIETLQGLLQEGGINSLAINLGLGIDNRHGMYDCATPHRHRHGDAVAEIGAWVAWLNAQGAGDIVLVGHSRGGNQTAWYASQASSPKIKGVILIAPMTREAGQAAGGYRKRFDKDLGPVLAEAQALADAGKGGTLMAHVDFVYCRDTSATAGAFVSYHGEEPRLNTPRLLAGIHVPVLVLAGSEDDVTTGLPEKLEPMADGGKVRLVVIDGADHFFRDLYAEEMAEAMVEFIQGL